MASLKSFSSTFSPTFCSVVSLVVLSYFIQVVISEDNIISQIDNQELVKRSSSSSWWFANITRNGSVPYGSSNWTLFRNVMDFGATGDGITDDFAAINASMMLGPRCLGQDARFTNPICESSTITPAVVYFPPGVYRVSEPIVMPYNTLVFGDALNMPTIKALNNFSGIAVLDSDPYYPGIDPGENWYANQNNFYRQVRNLIIDITEIPGTGSCIHWQVAQATSLQNLVFNMQIGGGSSNGHTGIFMENGSGGFMRDLIFNGGGIAFFLGNQQFTSTNLTFNNCWKGVRLNFDWIWSFKDLTFNNCTIGIDMWQDSGYNTDGNFLAATGNAMLADSTFNNVTTAIISQFNCTFNPPAAGSLVIDNVDFTGATNAITYLNGTVILPGGSKVLGWMQGPSYTSNYNSQLFPQYQNETCWVANAQGVCVQGDNTPPPRPAGLFNQATGKVFDRGKPTYDDWSVSRFVSAKANGCAGDGVTDDTTCLQNLFNNVTFNQIAYIDHGAYVVTQPIFIPANRRIVGEAWPKIMIKSSPIWSNQNNPVPAFVIGNKGDVGKLEMQDIVFQTMGSVPGAILMEINIEGDTQGSAGLWDVHWRIGGTAGTQLQYPTCFKTPSVLIANLNNNPCFASFLLCHVTETASVYMENNWGWVADHELDYAPNHGQINIWNGRGLLVESIKPFWLVGSSFEHSQLYNYGIHNAQNVYMSHIQSETAYMQGNPIATLAFPPNATWHDPDFGACLGNSSCIKTWGLRVYNSSYVYIYAAGMYSFFENYQSTVCLANVDCQDNGVSIEKSGYVYLYSLYTIGTGNLILMDNTKVVPYTHLINNTFGQSLASFGYP